MADLRQLLEQLQCQSKQLAHLDDRINYQAAQMRQLLDDAQVRENTYRVFEVNTNDHVAANPKLFDCLHEFGGPGNSFTVLDVGGGNLELAMNAGDWFAASSTTKIENFRFERLSARVTTAAAGTAKVWVGGLGRRRC